MGPLLTREHIVVRTAGARGSWLQTRASEHAGGTALRPRRTRLRGRGADERSKGVMRHAGATCRLVICARGRLRVGNGWVAVEVVIGILLVDVAQNVNVCG